MIESEKRICPPNWDNFQSELRNLINIHSMDVYFSTPDFQLAKLITANLKETRNFLIERKKWGVGRPNSPLKEDFGESTNHIIIDETPK